jgi:hypothetical protein
VLTLRTLGAPQRRFLQGRRGKVVHESEVEPVPTARATLVRPRPFGSREEANGWLAGIRGEEETAQAELAQSLVRLNRALHAQRVATGDPYVPLVSAERATLIRIGFGTGDDVANGRFDTAWELPRERSRTRRSMQAPEERFAAILGAREAALPAEELVLRARADLDADRSRESALQARVGLESLLADLAGDAPERSELEGSRTDVGEAANAALTGELGHDLRARLDRVVALMEQALRRRRLES